MNKYFVGEKVTVEIGYCNRVLGRVVQTIDDDDRSCYVVVRLPDGSACVVDTESPELNPVVH